MDRSAIQTQIDTIMLGQNPPATLVDLQSQMSTFLLNASVPPNDVTRILADLISYHNIDSLS